MQLVEQSGSVFVKTKALEERTGIQIEARIPVVQLLGSESDQVGLPAGENHLGEVGGRTQVSSAALTTSASPAYSSGDVVGNVVSLAMARIPGGTGLVQMVSLQCKSIQNFPCDVILFHTAPTSTFTDNAPLSVLAADFDKIIDVIHISDWTNLGIASFGKATQQATPFKIESSQTAGWAVLVSRGTPTLSSISDLKIVLKSLQD